MPSVMEQHAGDPRAIKAGEMESDLNRHRFEGKWQLVANELPKYHKRMGHSISAFEHLCNGEVHLDHFLNAYPHDIQYDDAPHFASGQNKEEKSGEGSSSVFLVPTFHHSELAEIARSNLTKALEHGEPLSAGDRYFAIVELAMLEVYSGKLKAAQDRVGALQSYPELSSGATPLEKSSRLLGNLVLGIIFHLGQNVQESIEHLRLAIDYGEADFDFQNEMVPETKDSKRQIIKPHVRWYEDSLFLLAMSYLRASKPDLAIPYLRRFALLKTGNSHSIHLRKKISVIYNYIDQSILLLGIQKGIAPASLKEHKIVQVLTPELRSDMKLLLPELERLMTSIYSFPRGEDISEVDKRRNLKIQKCYEWIYVLESTAPTADETLEEAVKRHYRLLEALYRGTRHTFQSLKLIRHLTLTFAGLAKLFANNMPMAEKKEALACARQYNDLYKKTLQVTVDLERKRHLQEAFVSDPEAITRRLSKSRGVIQSRNHTSQSTASFAKRRESSIEQANPLMDEVITVDEVWGETMHDAFAVLEASVTLIMYLTEGSEEKLTLGLNWALDMSDILHKHCPPATFQKGDLHYNALRLTGLLYAELALECRDPNIRCEYIQGGLQALQNAATLRPDDPLIQYQRALHLAECSKISESQRILKEVVVHKDVPPMAWNLYALLQTTHSCPGPAEGTVTEGIRAVMLRWFPQGKGSGYDWGKVPIGVKEEIFSMHLTKLAIRGTYYDPSPLLAYLKGIFKLYRAMFGTPERYDTAALQSSSPNVLSRAALDIQSNYLHPDKIKRFRFTSYDLLVCLWLSTASIYRHMNQFTQARAAVTKCQQVAGTIFALQTRIGKSQSRLFSSMQGKMGNSESMYHLDNKAERGEGDELDGYSAYFGSPSKSLRKIFADIAFESAMIRQQECNYLKSCPVNDSLWPAESALEESMQEFKDDSILEASMVSRASSIAPSISRLSLTEDQIINVGPSEQSPTNSNEEPFIYPIGQLIDLFKEILLIDHDHFPANVHLGKLYIEKGNFAAAEIHLEKACRYSKARGSTGGATGQATWYGGKTSLLGGIAWQLWNECFLKSNREEIALEHLPEVIQMKQNAACRGLECLGRFIV